jgi:FKBP-type peptidyl-prolyl cis-trans isomerase SlyD
MKKYVISFHYKLSDNAGKQIESSTDKEPLSFLEGVGQIIPDLENEISPMNVGDKKQVKIAHEKAYGVYDQKLIYRVPKDKFPAKDAKVGDVFQIGKTPQESQTVTVVEMNPTEVVLDANHPLAGVDLVFDVEVTDKREASVEEVAHGHAHGAHGHDHHH